MRKVELWKMPNEKITESVLPVLNGENFIKQIVEHGFLAEQFPACFSSESFAANVDKLLPLAPCTKAQVKKASNVTLPATLSTQKIDTSRRTLSLPNPTAFLRLVKLMQENWQDILNYAESVNSLSPVTYIHKYRGTDEKAMLNSENVRESICSKSDYVAGVKNRIKASLGYKYMLKVDVANCYDSIYTHSIAWAICGKEEAKKYLRSKTPEDIKDKYELADKLDTFIRYQKNNETNGILVGPFTSRIFSEIIFAAIDQQLREKYVFRRYVDDFYFYFRTEVEAKGSIPHIDRVLSKYGLHLNASKTKVTCFPHEILSQISVIFHKSYRYEGVFGVLNAASELYTNGEKGAYKYALKYIKDKAPRVENVEINISHLINILLIEPKNGKYVLNYWKKYFPDWKSEYITELINTELKVSIREDLQQETLIFLHIIKDLGLQLFSQNMINILKSLNDFAIIIVLDIWKNRKASVIRSKTQATQINKAIVQLSAELKDENYSGARWLLIYEIAVHGLMSGKLMPMPSVDEFFSKMHECGITFYQSLNDKLVQFKTSKK